MGAEQYWPRVSSWKKQAVGRIRASDGLEYPASLYGDIKADGLMQYLGILEVIDPDSGDPILMITAEESPFGSTAIGLFKDGVHSNLGTFEENQITGLDSFLAKALALLGDRFGYEQAMPFRAPADQIPDLGPAEIRTLELIHETMVEDPSAILAEFIETLDSEEKAAFNELLGDDDRSDTTMELVFSQEVVYFVALMLMDVDNEFRYQEAKHRLDYLITTEPIVNRLLFFVIYWSALAFNEKHDNTLIENNALVERLDSFFETYSQTDCD